jgi:4-carboxymuconolactone decarboxylase
MTEDFAKLFQSMMEQGQKMATAFSPVMQGLDVKGFEAMFPSMPKDMIEAWFGKTYNPDGLDARTRLLVTVAALTVLGAQNEPQLRLTIRQAMTAGATEREIAEVIWQMSMFGGLPAMQKALEIAQAIFAETKAKADPNTGQNTGEKNP